MKLYYNGNMISNLFILAATQGQTEEQGHNDRLKTTTNMENHSVLTGLLQKSALFTVSTIVGHLTMGAVNQTKLVDLKNQQEDTLNNKDKVIRQKLQHEKNLLDITRQCKSTDEINTAYRNQYQFEDKEISLNNDILKENNHFQLKMIMSDIFDNYIDVKKYMQENIVNLNKIKDNYIVKIAKTFNIPDNIYDLKIYTIENLNDIINHILPEFTSKTCTISLKDTEQIAKKLSFIDILGTLLTDFISQNLNQTAMTNLDAFKTFNAMLKENNYILSIT